jgi:ribose transport system substrate-binding protein
MLPLVSPPPKGKTIVYLQCQEDQCGLEAAGLGAAAKALGWTLKTLRFQETNPATLVSALNEALQYNPVGVYFAGLPDAVWSSVLPAYQRAGAVIVPNSIPDAASSPVVPVTLMGTAYSTREGQVLADEVATDSGGHANVLFVTVPQYPTFVPVQQAFTATLGSHCPGCKVTTTVSATIQDLLGGKLVPMIVSAVRTAPSTTYIASVDGAFLAGLTSALNSAGLGGKYKIVSAASSATNEQNILQGSEQASTGIGLTQVGWYAIDATLRHLEGMPLPDYNSMIPIPLLTKDTVGTPSATGDVNVPQDYAQQFQQLWKVS